MFEVDFVAILGYFCPTHQEAKIIKKRGYEV
jgi:hypothetical protein